MYIGPFCITTQRRIQKLPVVIIIIIIMEFAVAFPQSGSSSTVPRSNWNLEVLVFVEGGKPENPEKNPRSKDENQQQTQPTYDAGSGNQTQDTLVGSEHSHHCAIPAPLVKNFCSNLSIWLVCDPFKIWNSFRVKDFITAGL